MTKSLAVEIGIEDSVQTHLVRGSERIEMTIEEIAAKLNDAARQSLVNRDRYEIDQEAIDGEIDRAIRNMFKLSNFE